MKKLKTLGEVLDFAIAREVEASAFYQKLAENAPDGKARDVFLGFAADEVGHKRKLEGVKVKADEALLKKTIPPLEVNNPPVPPSATPDMNFKGALAVAIQKEKMSLDLYSAMADSSAFAPVKAVCIALSKEEEKHQLRLQSLYDQTA